MATGASPNEKQLEAKVAAIQAEITGEETGSITTNLQYVVAGSQNAQDVNRASVRPVIGAVDPAAQSLAQLATRFDGTPAAGDPVHAFPTKQ